MNMAFVSTLPDITNLETLYLIWLGTPPKNVVQQQLRSVINYVVTFDDEKQCIRYMNSLSKYDRIILIIREKSTQQFASQIAGLQQIQSVYIVIEGKHAHKQSTVNFNKVNVISVQCSALVARIQTDFNQQQFHHLDEILSIGYFSTSTTSDRSLLSNSNNHFVYVQMLIDCLTSIPLSSNENHEILIKVCKQQYKDNPKESSIIEKFEKKYSSERSIWWFTRHSFLSRLMNKAFQAENIDLLLNLRFFIRDIYRQLLNNKCLCSVLVYRAQLLSQQELKLLLRHTGEIISINSFLLASFNYERIMSFLTLLTPSNHTNKVIFEIHANSPSNDIRPFGNITSCHYSSRKDEILFMIGSIFRVLHVDEDGHGIWHVQLILCVNNNDHSLLSYIQQKKNEFHINDTDPLALGFVLEHMNKLNDAEKFYHQMLNRWSGNHADLSRCFHALGELAQKRGDYESSLKWYNQSLHNDTEVMNTDDSTVATTYNSIAVVYSRKGDYDSALESYKRALNIWKRALDENHLDISMCYTNMGIVYQEKKSYSNALECYHKAWYIRQQNLPVEHPSMGQSHACIGNVYHCLARYDLALEHYNLSLEIFQKSSMPQYSQIALLLRNIGLTYRAKRQYKQALFYLEKSLVIYRHLFTTIHPETTQIETIIQHISMKLNQ